MPKLEFARGYAGVGRRANARRHVTGIDPVDARGATA
jgi:hypothetical protein